MSLIVVNPSPKRRAKKAKRKTSTPAPKKATRKGVTMATKRRHRSPAQRRAFAKMISHNPHRRRRHRYASNPAPRRAVRRRRYNPAPARHYRRRRNPGGGVDMFKELLSTEGLIMVASIAAWPTVGGLLMTRFLPSMSGYTKYATQAGLGVAAGWLLHRFVNKQAGKMVALVSLGNGVAQCIQVYQGTLQGYQTLGSRVGPNGFINMAGYAPMGVNYGSLGGVPREPGRVNTARRIQ